MTRKSSPQTEHIRIENFDLRIPCHKCGQDLPLLHPHIMVERWDDQGNLICEAWFSQQ